jgi:preprotein translocase subunit SecD
MGTSESTVVRQGSDRILVQFPGLRPGALHAALAYYLDHQAEVDAMLEDDDRPVPSAIKVSV